MAAPHTCLLLSLVVAVPAFAAEVMVNAHATGTRQSNLRVYSPAREISHHQNASDSNTSTEQMLHSHTITAVASQVATQAPVAPIASMVDMHESKDVTASTPETGAAMVSQLQQELKEVKQKRMNIIQMQKALTADVALLRESSALQRVSATRHSRIAAQIQVRKTEQLVKDLSSMLRDSRLDAIDNAKTLLHDANQVRAAADALASEATAQLHSLSPRSGHHSHRVDTRQHANLATTETAESTPSPADSAPSKNNMDAVGASELDVDDKEDDIS